MRGRLLYLCVGGSQILGLEDGSGSGSAWRADRREFVVGKIGVLNFK